MNKLVFKGALCLIFCSITIYISRLIRNMDAALSLFLHEVKFLDAAPYWAKKTYEKVNSLLDLRSKNSLLKIVSTLNENYFIELPEGSCAFRNCVGLLV